MDFSARIEECSDAKVTKATLEAGDAQTSAENAKDAATIAKGQSDKATASASSAFTLAKGARKEADSFEIDIASAKTEAEGLKKRIADREVTPEQREKMLQVLKGLKPERIAVQSLLSEGREALQYEGEIGDVFKSAGWDVVPPDGMGSISNPTVGVLIFSATDVSAKQLDEVVAQVLIAGGVCAKPVRVTIESNKPAGNVEIWVAGK